MRRIIQSVLFTLLANHTFAQGMFGAQGGLGYCTSYKSYFTPSFDGYYLAKLSQHIYVGGSISIQRYSFLEDLDKDNVGYGDVLSIRQKSDYIFFSPKFDLGLGYHKYVHFNFSCGPGVFMGGNKSTDNYEPLVSSTGTYYGGDTLAFNNSGSMRTVIFRYEAGVMERIPTHGYWNITLSEEFSYISSKLNYPGTELKTNFFVFSIGIMHKYPHVEVAY